MKIGLIINKEILLVNQPLANKYKIPIPVLKSSYKDLLPVVSQFTYSAHILKFYKE